MSRSSPRIVMVARGFPGRSQTFLVSKFVGLRRLGYDVHVVCRHSDEDEWGRYPELDNEDARRRVHVGWPTLPRWRATLSMPIAIVAPLVRAPATAMRYWARSAGSILAAVRRGYLDSRLIELAPDLIHFEFGTLAVGRSHLKHALGCKLVVSFRGFDVSYAGLEQPHFYDEIWPAMDAAHCLGHDLWQRALRRGCPPQLRHRMISPAIDAEKFRASGQGRGGELGAVDAPVRLLSIGRLHWKKGHEYAIQAVRHLRDRGIHARLRIIGEGRHREAIVAAAAELAVSDSVELAGWLPPADVPAQLGWADLFLHAAVQEGFCNAVLEAQAGGLPVVSSDAEGLRENVADGETGLVVPRRDARALADAIQRLAVDPALRGEMSRKGPARVRALFTLPAQLAAFDQLYRDVLAQ